MYPAKVQKLVDTFLTCAAKTDPALRRAIESHAATLAGGDRTDEGRIPEELATYVEKVALYAIRQWTKM